MRGALKKIFTHALAAPRVASCVLVASLALVVFCVAAGAQRGDAPDARASAAAKRSTPAQYGARAVEAAASLEELADFYERVREAEKPEVWSREGFNSDFVLELPRVERETLAEARALIPPKEKIETGGAQIEVDNAWLHAGLAEWPRASLNKEQRAAALRAWAERLRAIGARLSELETATPQALDKDAERGRLNAILRDPAFAQQAQQGGALQRFVEQIVEWIRNLLDRLFPSVRISPQGTQRYSLLAQFIVFGLCAAVIAYIVWVFWKRRAAGGKPSKRKRKARVVLGERLEADQTSADLLEDAERLARAGDLRGAIRKAYIALLCELGDRNVIGLAQHKTNRDYLNAVRRAAPQRLYAEMLPLTFNFELHWYGLQEASDSDWDDFRARCRQALKTSSV